MGERRSNKLRVLITNEPRELSALARKLVETLGHDVVTPRFEGGDAAAVLARERPDVALVTIGKDAERALALIEEIVREARCPVVALTDSTDAEVLRAASRLGVFAYLTDGDDGEDWQIAIDIGLRRFDDFRKLEAAFGRRAVIERAKGILMERHSVDDAIAFGLLRNHSRSTNRRLIDVAGAVAEGHALLRNARPAGAERRPSPPGPGVLGAPEIVA